MDNSNPHSSKILKFPSDFETLQAEIAKLRVELSMLVLERDTVLHQECKNIEMAYMLSIGALEYKAYRVECMILRLKRKIGMIQAKINRQEQIVLDEIEASLDVEFAEYEARLNEQVHKMNEALERSRARLLTQEESHELKKLYHAIVKALHPDLHPDLSEAKIRLFHNAVEAYKHGDLDGLRIIEVMVSESADTPKISNKFAILKREKERLTRLLQCVQDSIAKIKSEFPYTMKSLVNSPEKTAIRKRELERQIVELNEALTNYTAKVETMLR